MIALTPAQKAVYTRLKSGKRRVEVARELGISKPAVQQTIQRIAAKGYEVPAAEVVYPRPRFDEVAPMLERGLTTTEIAAQTGLSKGRVSNIRRAWKQRGAA